MMWVCIGLSAGWAIGVVSLVLFSLALAATPDEGPLPRGVALLGLSSIVLLTIGLGSCAIEERFCEMAEREANER